MHVYLCTGVKRASQEPASVPSKKPKEAPQGLKKTRRQLMHICTVKYLPLLCTCIYYYFLTELPEDVRQWTLDNVEHYFNTTSDCREHALLLKEQEVDGAALLLLTSDTLVRCLGLKLGPALKIMMHVEELKAQQLVLP